MFSDFIYKVLQLRRQLGENNCSIACWDRGLTLYLKGHGGHENLEARGSLTSKARGYVQLHLSR